MNDWAMRLSDSSIDLIMKRDFPFGIRAVRKGEAVVYEFYQVLGYVNDIEVAKQTCECLALDADRAAAQ